MPEHDSQPNADAAIRIARWMGPALLLALVLVWGAALLLPERDRQRFLDIQAAGLVELPPAPPPDREPGIDNRVLDPSLRDAANEANPGGDRSPMSLDRMGPPGEQPPHGEHRPPPGQPGQGRGRGEGKGKGKGDGPDGSRRPPPEGPER